VLTLNEPSTKHSVGV